MTALAAIIVAHDSDADLERALPPLMSQLRPGDELVVVDNASASPVAARPGVRLVRCDDNRGYAGGAVVGAAASQAPLLLLLNPDAVVQPGCLDRLRDTAYEQPRWGAWQALVTLADTGEVNTAGNIAHWTGLGWAGGYGEPLQDVGGSRTVGFASGAALVVRRTAWETAGGFDARYFMYAEDLDLSLRLRLHGWDVGMVADALVEHGYAFEKGEYKWYYLERNRWWTVLSDYPASLLLLVLPALLALEVALLVVAMQGGWLRAKLRSQLAVVRDLPAILRRRRAVQAARCASVGTFAAGFSATLDSPFLGPAARFGPAVALQRGYWRFVMRVLRWTSA